MEEEKVAHAGSFCWNEACADYGQVGKGNIIKNGKTDKGVCDLTISLSSPVTHMLSTTWL